MKRISHQTGPLQLIARNISIMGIFILSLTAAKAQTPSFSKQWNEIDSLIVKKSLPKSALQKVNALYEKAVQQKASGEIIKALIYKISLNQQVEDKSVNNEFSFLQKEEENLSGLTEKSILYVLEAQLLQNRYNQNRWQIARRSQTVNYIKTDIDTWAADDFHKAITRLYYEALQPVDALQTVSLERYNPVIIKGNARNLRPTLYDLLAHIALDYFKSGDAYLTKPEYAFTINDSAALSNTQIFVTHRFESKDSLSHQLLALKFFQQLIQFHLKDNSPEALIDVDLERIQWAYSNAVFNNKEENYAAVLNQMLQNTKYQKSTDIKQTSYLLAQYYANKADSYKPYGDTSHRYDYIKAKSIIGESIKGKDTLNEGWSNLRTLDYNITSQQLNLQTEAVNVPQQPFRMLVQYKNVNTLYYRILRGSDVKKIADNLYQQGAWKKLTKLPSIKTGEQSLPETSDYQQHATEIRIDALPPGSYALLASSGNNFIDSVDKLSLLQFDVSNISYVQNGSDYFVLHRETGQPLQNITVKIKQNYYDYNARKSVEKYIGTVTPDTHGKFNIPQKKNAKDENRDDNYTFSFYGQGDTLIQNNSSYVSRSYSSDDEGDNDTEAQYQENKAQLFFFTDRAIYRPGQVVYFKAIALTKNKNEQHAKLYRSKDSITVYLNDANDKEVDSLKLFLNDYASINGKFTIPENVLTGDFTLEAKDINGKKEFKVEEYKRPNFYVEFDTLKSTYRLNDTIIITGHAKAFAGNAIDGAKVSVNITRNTRFIYDWLFWYRPRPQSASKQILTDSLVTDAEGKFEIKFLAEPDLAIDKNTKPQFNFNVSATVTDLNGETHEQNTSASVGYQSINLKLGLPTIADANSLKEIPLSVQNLSGTDVPANVQIKVYPLQTPERLIRERYWQRPDVFIMNKENYIQTFPYDEYDNETNNKSWAKLPALVNAEINTATQKKYDLHNTPLKQGWYCVEAVTKDKGGEEIKDIQYMQVFNPNETALAYPQYNWNYTLQSWIKQGDTVRLLMGTSAKDVYLISTLDRREPKKDFIPVYTYTQLSNKVNPLTVKTNDNDRLGAGLSYAFVKNNRFYNGSTSIYITDSSKILNIQYATFRNKTEPGSKENWTIKINGTNGEKAAAELLTAMYDASLDQFIKQEWNIPSLQNEDVRYFDSRWGSGNDNFSKQGSQDNYLNRYSRSYYKRYDRVAMSNEDFLSDYRQQEYNKTLDAKGYPRKGFKIGTINQGGAKSDEYIAEYRMSRKTALAGVNAVPASRPATQDAPKMEIVKFTAPKIAKDEERHSSDSENLPQQNDNSGAIQIRKNFNETAFFIPQLYADTKGNYSFSFTMPESLTKWKWLSLAHTKDAVFGQQEQEVITQKTLMVQPNLPRFLREGDAIIFTTKISNLGDKPLSGKASIQLFDAITNEPVSNWLNNNASNTTFNAPAGQSTSVSFPVNVPKGYTNPVTIRIIADGRQYSDGEERTLPVLSNRTLVTESLPLFVKGDTTKHFVFEKLVNNKSETLQSQSLTVEYTANPVWNAVQSLPYLMEFPHECAEQTFNRFYANVLAAYIVDKYPRIKTVFERWKTQDTAALQSNLQKNEELKQVLLQETPWVLQAESETQQKKNIALLFDMVKMSVNTASALKKLEQMQLSNGGFSWFKGGEQDRYITQYILAGIGRLKKLNAVSNGPSLQAMNTIATKAMNYLDGALDRDYQDLKKQSKDISKTTPSSIQIQYLYARSYFTGQAYKGDAFKFYYGQMKKYWQEQSAYFKAMMATTFYRNGDKDLATGSIVKSILENAVENDSVGMYWKDMQHGGWYWYEAPIEKHASVMEAVDEIAQTNKDARLTQAINGMQQWLILQKQTTNWKTTKATADACYALLLTNGVAALKEEKQIEIKLGNNIILPQSGQKTEAGSGYFKTTISANNIKPELGNITVTSTIATNSTKGAEGTGVSYGGVYWQYFEDLDKITPAATPLMLHKKLFIEKNTTAGKQLVAVNNNDVLHIGDKVVVRVELKADRDMEYVHLKDMRAAAMEPQNVLSSYKWQDGLGYYEATKDASTNFFISYLRKGTYVFEYPLFITNAGNFSVGIANIQCMYAPEFSSHSEGIRIKVSPPDVKGE